MSTRRTEKTGMQGFEEVNDDDDDLVIVPQIENSNFMNFEILQNFSSNLINWSQLFNVFKENEFISPVKSTDTNNFHYLHLIQKSINIFIMNKVIY